MEQEKKWILIDNEKFYYQEVKLYHGRQKINFEIARENLEIFYEVMEQSGIRYGLILGTLLGAVREKNFIAHDQDTDIFILYEERERFLKLLYNFKEQGLELVRVDSDMLSLMRKNEYIDVLFFKLKRKFGIKRMRVSCNDYEISAHYLEEPIKMNFLGLDISVPNNPEELLLRTYGKNWKTPIANSPAPSNTFYKRLSHVAIYLKKLSFYPPLEKFIKAILQKLGL